MIADSLLDLSLLFRNLRLPAAELERYRTRKMRNAVNQAYNEVPYYRRLFDDAGIRPETIRSLQDLAKIPITRKEDLIDLPVTERVQAGAALKSCLGMMTSGSSGAPFHVWFNRRDKRMRVLSDVRSLLFNGLTLTDRTLLLVDPSHTPERKFWFQRAGILDREYLSLYAGPEEKLQALRGGRHQALRGLTAELALLARDMLRRGISIPAPKLVLTSADLLGPESRGLIRDAFGTDPVDYYGAMEFGYIAWQCRERSIYHINCDLMEVELIRGGRPCRDGEVGEVVVTNFFSKIAPLIRYSLGDLAVRAAGGCPCGCPFPGIKEIHGRMVDTIRLPSGEQVSPYALICAVETVDGVAAFQIIQSAPAELLVEFVSKNLPDDTAGPLINDKLGAMLGGQMKVSVRRVEAIDRPRGKFRLVRNAVRPGAGHLEESG